MDATTQGTLRIVALLGAGMSVFENLLAQTIVLALREHPNPEQALSDMRDGVMRMLKTTEADVRPIGLPGELPGGLTEKMFDTSLATANRVLDYVSWEVRRQGGGSEESP